MRELFFDESPLDDIVACMADMRRGDEALGVQNPAGVFEHLRAAAQHRSIVLRVERRQADVLRQFAAFDEIGQSPLILKRFARRRRVVDQLVAHQIAEEFMLVQILAEIVAIGEFAHQAHAMHQHDFFRSAHRL